MKKTLIAFFLIFSFSASAQRYTLQFGQREPTFYYWGEHWIDHCPRGILRSGPMGGLACPTYLRFCTTTDTLKIIGIAGCAAVYGCDELVHRYIISENSRTIYDTVNRLPEYFQLYKATSSDPVLLAEARYDTTHPRYQIVYEAALPGHFETDSMPIYEAYFDKPIEVTDSFFVGGTSNNNYVHYDESLGRYNGQFEHKLTYYLCSRMLDNDEHIICTVTPHKYMTTKLNTWRYGHPHPDLDRVDTTWHVNDTINQIHRYNAVISLWPWFFPIIDTTGMGLDGFQWVPGFGCDTVRTFRLLYVEGRQAYLSWSANRNAAYYEVSYGPEGTAPDQGIKVRTSTSMVCLDSLEPGRRYVAYARTRCTNDAYGGWSDCVTFRIPGSGGTIEDASLASRFTAVMPNPATTQATVISSFTINRIEVYTAAGQHVLTTEPKANAAALDLSTLSAGTYLLRIQTSAGDTAKRLVVQ